MDALPFCDENEYLEKVMQCGNGTYLRKALANLHMAQPGHDDSESCCPRNEKSTPAIKPPE